MIMVITCDSSSEAKTVALELTRQADILGVSPEYFERLGITYSLFNNVADFKAKYSSVTSNMVILKVEKMLDKSMTLVDFLAKNKGIRKVDDVAMYFKRSTIDEAIKMGAINILKGCIIV